MISDELLARMTDPAEELPVLVTLRESATGEDLAGVGFHPERSFPDIRVLAGRARPAVIHALAACEAVASVELDGRVDATR